MLPLAFRNTLIGIGMFIVTIIAMFFFGPTREFLIRTVAIFGLTEKICEKVKTQGEIEYEAKKCKEELNIFGQKFSVDESF